MFSVYLRFFVGNYNAKLEDLSPTHSQSIGLVKVEIANFFEEILKSISDGNMVAYVSVKIFPHVIKNLESAHKDQDEDQIINYLNFLKYLCFQT